jgi:hypothetical protein
VHNFINDFVLLCLFVAKIFQEDNVATHRVDLVRIGCRSDSGGVKNGWLPAETYGPAARRAWLGLVAHLDEGANVRDVCVGTNKANAEVGSDQQTQLKYYIDRPRRVGDLHGQAALLWSATALLR